VGERLIVLGGSGLKLIFQRLRHMCFPAYRVMLNLPASMGTKQLSQNRKEINHEITKGPRLNKAIRFNGAGENTKKGKLNFVLSRFRVFVMKIFFHKMHRFQS